MFDYNEWHYRQYVPKFEGANRLKGFLSLLFITFLIVCGVALAVYLVYIYRVHPELLFGEEPVTQFHGIAATTLFC